MCISKVSTRSGIKENLIGEGMAQSIPPNLEGGNSLTWKTKLETRVIYKRKRNKKEIFHIPNGNIKTKTLSVTSKWHIKSTLCKT
jgi:hypothetical protein